MSDEDRQIISDFVIESLENLGTIEVNLINLEQDPTDQETINAIFRPFHTIKGVSGFLSLGKINRLAHNAENLLDKARNREIRVEGMVIDIILESVDVLKRMIEGVREGLEQSGPLDNGIDIGPISGRIEEILSNADLLSEKPLGEILVTKGAVKVEDVEKSLTRQKEEPEKRIGQILVEENKAETKDVISALRDQKKFNHQHIDLQVKVDTKKLDNLVDLTGELVINQAMLRQNQWVVSSKDQKLYHNLNQLNQITSSLQRTAMSMRMVPIRNTFQKMVRLVRDLAKNSGKEVQLNMEGEDTEIDRNVVEELYEPMVHMIRNAVDHGLEQPQEREKLGKPRQGRVLLRAYHRGGHIIIEIQDDGRGLDKERILQKARSLQTPRGRRQADRSGDLQLHLPRRLLHGSEGHGDFRQGRRDGRGEKGDREAARQSGDPLQEGRRGNVRDQPPSHPGHHRRHGGAGGEGEIHHPGPHDPGILQTGAEAVLHHRGQG